VRSARCVQDNQIFAGLEPMQKPESFANARHAPVFAKIPPPKSSLVPLDLALPRPSMAWDSGVEAAGIDIKLDRLIIDSADLKPVSESGAQEGASTQAARYMIDREGNRYRLKCNANRPGVTFHEVFAAQMLNAMGFSCAPAASFVSDSARKLGPEASDVWVASPQVPDFKDLGAFLVKSGKEHVPPEQRSVYEQHLGSYNKACNEAQRLLAKGPAAELMKGYRKGGVDELDARQHTVLQPLRDCYRNALQAQERMWSLLPPSFHDELLRAFYTSEIVGNWDFLNHDRANTGFAIEDGAVKAYTVDFGNSGPIGFGGKGKRDSLVAANQPARKDDPYLRIPDGVLPGGYMQSNLNDADIDTQAVSHTFGAAGQIPRSAVSAHMLAPVIVQERGRSAGDEPLGTAPAQALEIAWHLASLPKNLIRQFAGAFFRTGLPLQ
jgi:hypothetical protein